MEIMLENYCDECDKVVHAIVDSEQFAVAYRGAIRCPECGHPVMPCNECRIELDNDPDCNKCPYRKMPLLDAITDEEFVEWHRKNEPVAFSAMLAGELGDLYGKIAKNLVDKAG